MDRFDSGEQLIKKPSDLQTSNLHPDPDSTQSIDNNPILKTEKFLDQQNSSDKLNMGVNELTTLKSLEDSLLSTNTDNSSMQLNKIDSIVKSLPTDSVETKNIMNVLEKDLRELGISASYNIDRSVAPPVGSLNLETFSHPSSNEVVHSELLLSTNSLPPLARTTDMTTSSSATGQPHIEDKITYLHPHHALENFATTAIKSVTEKKQ